MGIKKYVAAITLAASLMANNASAASFIDTTLLAQVFILYGTANALLGAQEALPDIYSDADESKLAALKETIGIHEEMTKAQTDHILALLKQHALAQTTGMNAENFNSVSVSDYAPSAEFKTVEQIKGQKVGVVVESEITGLVEEYNSKFGHTGDAIRAIAVDDETAKNLLDTERSLLPVGGITQDSEDMARQIVMLGQPVPPRVMNAEAHGNSPYVVFYERQRYMKNTTISVVQKILARQAKNVIPAYKAEGEWWDDLTSQFNGKVPNIDKDPNGYVSKTSFQNVQVAARYGNPNWVPSIHQMNSTGLLRTYASMQALELELKKDLHYANQDVRLLLSVMNSEEARELYYSALNQTKKGTSKGL